MATPRGALADVTAGAPGAAAWRFDPWTERPWAASLAVLAVLAMWLVIARGGFPWLVAVALGAAAASPLWAAFSRADCRVDAAGAARRGVLGWVRRSWAEVRRIDEVPAGVVLSPHRQRHWWDAGRVLVLPMPRSRRAELAALVRATWQAHGG